MEVFSTDLQIRSKNVYKLKVVVCFVVILENVL